MLINKIGFDFEKRNYSKTQYNQKNKTSNSVTNSIELPNVYYVPFSGKGKNAENTKLSKIMYMADTPSKNLIKSLEVDAKLSDYNSITTMHVIKNQFTELYKYIEDLDSGKKDFDTVNQPVAGKYLAEIINARVIRDPEQRKLVKPILENYINEADIILKNNQTDLSTTKEPITFSEDLTDSVWSYLSNIEGKIVTPEVLFYGAMFSQDNDTAGFRENFVFDLEDALMQNSKPLEERAPFSEYESKAKNVLKNLSLGTNMFVTYDSQKDTYINFIDTVKDVCENQGKYNFIELNMTAKSEYFYDIVNLCSKDKENEYIIGLPPFMLLYNDTEAEAVAEGKLSISPYVINPLQNQPSNVKFLFYDSKVNYDALSDMLGVHLASFEEMRIPTLSTEQMIKSFKENPILMKDIQLPFTKKAIEKAVEASAQLDGVFPEKTQKLMKKIVSYNINKKEITEKDVNSYLKEATHLFKKNSDDSSIEVVFDTGKRLKDMVGKTSTQKEASILVKQIKSKKMGTKGVITYSQDGSAGSGRRFTAKAIAGEAGVPYIEINTMDFGTKEVDLFGGGMLSPEASVKKLFSVVSAQADANSHKSAVLFIDNFEYFSVSELVSFYHQKAMAQLLREMDKADKAGLNILVIGSVADPSLIGEATMKSFKFVDSIEVSSPAFNEEERYQVIEKAFKNEKLKLAGSKDSQKEILEYAAQISAYFPYIQLKNLVKKAGSISSERGHKFIDKGDITEAYLQITTGRPSVKRINNHEKRITAAHECGHATNLEVMNNIAKTLGNPWHIPNKVNFITLDPRGYYGGAVYEGQDKNRERSFETMFSDMVCAFGGYSCENKFNKMNGSFGITCDMASVRACAEEMVKEMCMGSKVGSMVINKGDDLSEDMKKMIEDDERVIINNAQITSNLIIDYYGDFVEEFADKYAPLVGTGNCIIDGDEFRRTLVEWKNRQSPQKQKELDDCDKTIMKIIEATKKGIAVRKA